MSHDLCNFVISNVQVYFHAHTNQCKKIYQIANMRRGENGTEFENWNWPLVVRWCSGANELVQNSNFFFFDIWRKHVNHFLLNQIEPFSVWLPFVTTFRKCKKSKILSPWICPFNWFVCFCLLYVCVQPSYVTHLFYGLISNWVITIVFFSRFFSLFYNFQAKFCLICFLCSHIRWRMKHWLTMNAHCTVEHNM